MQSLGNLMISSDCKGTSRGKTSRITIFIDQTELDIEAITKLAKLINKKQGVKRVQIERNLIG